MAEPSAARPNLLDALALVVLGRRDRDLEDFAGHEDDRLHAVVVLAEVGVAAVGVGRIEEAGLSVREDEVDAVVGVGHRDVGDGGAGIVGAEDGGEAADAEGFT